MLRGRLGGLHIVECSVRDIVSRFDRKSRSASMFYSCTSFTIGSLLLIVFSDFNGCFHDLYENFWMFMICMRTSGFSNLHQSPENLRRAVEKTVEPKGTGDVKTWLE